MRIYDVSCSAYSVRKKSPIFGFYYPAMERMPKEAVKIKKYVYKHESVKVPKDGVWLKGKLNETLDKLNLDNYKKRHVNIKGSQEKIERVTFNRFAREGVVQKYQQDLYPNGDLITIIKSYCKNAINPIQEFIENIK